MTLPAQDDIRDALLAIYQERGYLDAAAVVEEGRDPQSALHSRLTWDDTQAAHKQRLTEARRLIRSVKITIIDATTNQPEQINFFVASKPAAQALAHGGDDQDEVTSEVLLRSSYVPAPMIGQDPMLARVVLKQMEVDFHRLQRRWGAYKEFWDMVASEAQGRAS